LWRCWRSYWNYVWQAGIWRIWHVLTAPGVFAKVITGASVSAGNLLESDATGRAVAFTYVSNAATGTYTVGRAVTESGAANGIITVLTGFCPSSKS